MTYIIKGGMSSADTNLAAILEGYGYNVAGDARRVGNGR